MKHVPQDKPANWIADGLSVTICRPYQIIEKQGLRVGVNFVN